MENYKYIILGSGIAGYNSMLEIQKESDDYIMISKEGPTYLRPILSKTTFTTYNINLTYLPFDPSKLIQEEVISIDPDQQIVNGKYHYEKLIYALGAESRKLTLDQEVFYLRSAEDFYTMKRKLPFSKSVAVVGGGVIGIEIALMLAKLNKQVTIYEYAPLLLGRYFNENASNYLLEQLKQNHINVILNSRKTAYQEDLIIGCIGNSVNNLFKEPLIPDEYLQFKNNIYICGDCVSGNAALWDEALKQGKIAGQNALGKQIQYIREQLPLIMNHEDWSIYATTTTYSNFEGVVHYAPDLYINNKKEDTYLSIQDGKLVLIGNIHLLEEGEQLWKS